MSRINPPIPMYMWHPPEESNPYCWLRTPQCYPLHQRGRCISSMHMVPGAGVEPTSAGCKPAAFPIDEPGMSVAIHHNPVKGSPVYTIRVLRLSRRCAMTVLPEGFEPPQVTGSKPAALSVTLEERGASCWNRTSLTSLRGMCGPRPQRGWIHRVNRG
jgi:hypothetical protein